jgi:hypothetical protein
MLGNESPVRLRVEKASPIFPDIADAKFPIGDDAMVAAQEAMNFVGFQFLIKVGFLHHWSTSSSHPLYHILMKVKIQYISSQNTEFPLYDYQVHTCIIKRFLSQSEQW